MASEILILHELFKPDGDNCGAAAGTITLASISNPFSTHFTSISPVPEPQDIKCAFLPPCLCPRYSA